MGQLRSPSVPPTPTDVLPPVPVLPPAPVLPPVGPDPPAASAAPPVPSIGSPAGPGRSSLLEQASPPAGKHMESQAVRIRTAHSFSTKETRRPQKAAHGTLLPKNRNKREARVLLL